jgi:hypothetical protein
MNRLLWVVQALLALLFFFAGGAKLVMSATELTAQTPLPAAFPRFIGVLEILGRLGLVLPGMLRIRTGLTATASPSFRMELQRLSKGRFMWWPEADGPTKGLEAYEAQLLVAASDVSRVRAAPMWLRVNAPK